MLLDAGSSAEHTRTFLAELEAAGVPPPTLVVLTHSHWDHVFGAAELGVPVVAHRRTAEYLDELAETDWSDEGLERRLAAGEVSEFHVANVKQELPSPRDVRVARADVVFEEAVTFDLGGVTVLARHLPNDHSDDGCVAFVEPDRVLFVGDATYDSPNGVLTTARAFPLHDALAAFRPEHVVTGHEERVETGAELEKLREKVRLAAELAAAGAEPGDEHDEDMHEYVRAFAAGAGQA
jgi:glyoxylase-like metal-dependent hydrolase (beta-lactamase superfamily II)